MTGPENVDTPPVPASTTTVGGRYRLLHSLGRGAMGDVYLAEDTRLRRQVALKCIRAEHVASAVLLERIKRECLLHARIGAHPHIVTLYDLLDGEEQIHLVMEYVAGQTLDKAMKEHAARGTRLPLYQSLSIAIQCLEALAHVHRHGIIHRDIKPGNVILTQTAPGKVCAKLMDFGIARMEEDDPAAATLTRPGDRSPGTPLYMSPEQIDSKAYGSVTPASDIYAVGVMLYHLLAGKPPFTGTLTDIFNGHLNYTPKPIILESGLPLDPELGTVIAKALAKRPAARHPSAGALADALRPFLIEGPPVAEAPVGVAARPHGARKGNRIGWGAAVVLCLLAVGAAIRWNGSPGDVDFVTEESPPILSEQALEAMPDELEGVPDPGALHADTAEAGAGQSTLGPAAPMADGAERVPAEAPDAGKSDPDLPADWTPQHWSLDAVTLPVAPPWDVHGGAGMEPGAAPATLPEIIPPGPSPTAPGEDAAGAPPEPVSTEVGTDGDLEAVTVADAAPSDGPIHVVVAGDTIQDLAETYKLSAADLVRWNALRDPNALRVGQVLYLYERPGLEPVEAGRAGTTEQSGKGAVRGVLDRTKKGIKNIGRKVKSVGK